MRTEKLELKLGKKVYFVSDFHLGAPDDATSLKRERKIIRWLDSIETDAQAIIFVGDVYDFWFEYKYAVPKGFIRFQGKLASLADAGIQLYFFPGNHDLWMFDYYIKELNAIISRKPIIFTINDKKIFVVHGDGYGPGDTMHKLMLKIFENKLCQSVFQNLPNWCAFGLAHIWSKKSRISNSEFDEKFLGDDEWLWAYVKSLEATNHHDFYVFGHRHLTLDLKVGASSRYINLGEWFNSCHYAVFDGYDTKLEHFSE